MLMLIAVFCVVGQPRICQRHTFFLPPGVAETGCYVAGQFQIAQWLGENPGYTIKTWSCGVPDVQEKA